MTWTEGTLAGRGGRPGGALTLKGADGLLQGLLAGDVQVVGGLVQHQQRALAQRSAAQRSTAGAA